MSKAHTQGKLHSHNREIHIYNEEPLDHICIAEVNNALLDPQPVVDEFIKRWNNHDEIVEALKKIAEPEGIYSNDRLAYCENVIKNMVQIAQDVLKKT